MSNPLVTWAPGTDKTRFDFLTLLEEWHDYLSLDGGRQDPDPELIVRLSLLHHSAFEMAVLEECGIHWDDLSGTFGVPQELWMMAGGRPPVTREALDLLWTDIFRETEDLVDDVENVIESERDTLA